MNALLFRLPPVNVDVLVQLRATLEVTERSAVPGPLDVGSLDERVRRLEHRVLVNHEGLNAHVLHRLDQIHIGHQNLRTIFLPGAGARAGVPIPLVRLARTSAILSLVSSLTILLGFSPASYMAICFRVYSTMKSMSAGVNSPGSSIAQ